MQTFYQMLIIIFVTILLSFHKMMFDYLANMLYNKIVENRFVSDYFFGGIIPYEV